MIEVENLNKRYGSLPAVSDVSFRCSPGTVTGFVGPNGAGKSTTLRMICGLAEPSSGGATVLGAAYRAIPNPGRSHLLREVEKIADELVVIGGGRVVAQGAADELLVDGVDLEDLFLSLLAEGASR